MKISSCLHRSKSLKALIQDIKQVWKLENGYRSFREKKRLKKGKRLLEIEWRLK
jgi:hypothetical protein